jgi:NADH-ubiquinone oxidoreductase chain 5
MYLLILTFPLIGSLVTGFLGRFLGRYGTAIISIMCVCISMLLSFVAFYEVALLKSPCYILLLS